MKLKHAGNIHTLRMVMKIGLQGKIPSTNQNKHNKKMHEGKYQ